MSTSDLPPAFESHQDLIDQFLSQFTTGGMPSERTLVRLFITQHLRDTGTLPSGSFPVKVCYRGETIWGKSVDFSPLRP